MAKALNRVVGDTEHDHLIYDGSHPIDVRNVVVTIAGGEAGTLKRGQVIDYANGAYSVHQESGEVSSIVAETTEYAESDTEVVVSVYTSGTFRIGECITDVELTTADLETFRSKNIYLK